MESATFFSKHYGKSISMQTPLGLLKKKNVKADGQLRESIVRDIEENSSTFYEASLKYDVSASCLCHWLKLYQQDGADALYRVVPIGRSPNVMGRPRKKIPDEITELERFWHENALLKNEGP